MKKEHIFAWSLLAAGMLGCMAPQDGDDKVPYVAPSDTDDGEDTLDTYYDTEPPANPSFDYDFTGLPFVGMNLSGPEWGTAYWPNPVLFRGYDSYGQYFHQWGLRTVRLPIKWERLQRELEADFDEYYLESLRRTLFTLRSQGATVILDVHNYARYKDVPIGYSVSNEAFADLWRRLATMFRDYPEVIFGLMNEPWGMETERWVAAANAAIAAIRETGAQNLIFINGNAWSGAHSWYQSWYGTPNATAMLDVVDPLGTDRLIFEVHQYLNEGYSDWGECVSETIGSAKLQQFTQWLRDNGRYGFLGEFGVEDSATCLAALDDMLTFIEDNADVWVGWTWWAAGPGCASWQAPTDPFCWTKDQQSSPQLDVLLRHLRARPDLYVNSQ